MTTTRNNLAITRRRHGVTLVEILVVIVIISILLGALFWGVRSLSASGKHRSAIQQIAQITNAIDQYASFWPRWEMNGTVLADRGWPDYSPWRLFASDQLPAPFTGPYLELTNFNDDPTFVVADFPAAGTLSGIKEDNTPADGRGPDTVEIGDVLIANVCLAYSLTQPKGKGPYLHIDDSGALFRPLKDVDSTIGNPMLPLHTFSNSAERATLLVDPWGMPYRYFWYFRDDRTPQLSYRGIVPCFTADPTDPNFRKADGYVIESAGPDRRYGNVWFDGDPANLTAAQQREVLEAADNIIRVVP